MCVFNEPANYGTDVRAADRTFTFCGRLNKSLLYANVTDAHKTRSQRLCSGVLRRGLNLGILKNRDLAQLEKIEYRIILTILYNTILYYK